MNTSKKAQISTIFNPRNCPKTQENDKKILIRGIYPIKTHLKYAIPKFQKFGFGNTAKNLKMKKKVIAQNNNFKAMKIGSDTNWWKSIKLKTRIDIIQFAKNTDRFMENQSMLLYEFDITSMCIWTEFEASKSVNLS